MTDNNEIWIEELGYIPKELLLDRLGVEKIILNDDYARIIWFGTYALYSYSFLRYLRAME